MKTVSLLLLALVAGCRTTAPRPLPMDQHSFANANQTRVTHVDLELALDFDSKRVEGTATLALDRRVPGAPLVLDARGLDIDAVTGSDGTARSFSMGPELPGLGGPLTVTLEPEDRSVAVRYRTSPGAEALQWLAPEQTAGGRAPFLFSQGQSILTRSWIPIQDSPGVRVTYSATVRAPEGLVPVMSAESSERLEDGRTLFRMSSPIPPYLIAIGCGDLAFRAISDRCGVWADPTIVERAAAEFEDTEAMIVSAESLFGPYRWGRYDVLVLPPAFPFGGMENPCLTFATPTILAGDKSLVSLIAHELAHSWSGNLVTNATWSDFWLNEGFTVYFEARIMEEVFGEERAIMEKALGYDGLVREIAEMEPRDTVLAIDLDGRHPDDGFSGVPYEKGALFLRRLEEVFGRETFDHFLRRWFDEHAFESVTTADFVAFLEEHLFEGREELAARVDVHRWVHGPGLPETAPVLPSRSMDVVDSAAEDFAAGRRSADELDTEGWVTQQWLRFLEALSDRVDSESMAELDRAFGLTQSGNSEILCVWLRLAVKHDYRPADARLEAFLTDVGRAKFLKPLYRELARVSPSRARALYETRRARYHAVAHASLDTIIENAGRSEGE